MRRTDIMRWAGVPSSLIVGAIIAFLVHALLRSAVIAIGGINPDGGVAQFVTVPFPAVVGSASAVALATFLAPSHKRLTTTVLLAVLCGAAVVCGVPAILSGGQHYAVVFASAGTAFGAYVSREILQFDEP